MQESVLVPVRGARQRVAAAVVGLAGVVMVLDGCGMPLGTTSGVRIAIFNGIPGSYALEPAGVAILGVWAAVLLLSRRVNSGWRRAGAGMLLASGIQTTLMFAGYLSGGPPGSHVGVGPIVGMLGGLGMAAAGVLGVMAGARRKAAPARPPGEESAEAYVPGHGDGLPAGIRRVLRGYAGLAWAAVAAGPVLVLAALGVSLSPSVDNPNGWQDLAAWAMVLAGLGLWIWAVNLIVDRHRFAVVARRPDDPFRATVTAADPHARTLVVHPPAFKEYLPDLTMRLAWWAVTGLPQPGDTVTYYGRPTGRGPLLVTTSEPARVFLATGTRQPLPPEASKPSEPAVTDAAPG